MTDIRFRATKEQSDVIAHSRSAFISACPGAGKTQVLVERARQELANNDSGQGLAFLSFTNAAITELMTRLHADNLLANPPFPHYVGTFDTFIWQFFIAPLGVPGSTAKPRLVPDLGERCIRAGKVSRELPLSCFDPETGAMILTKAKRLGVDATTKPTLKAAYEAAAKACRAKFCDRGELSFDDVRRIIRLRMDDDVLSAKLSLAIATRFREIVVDEAQDCNASDIHILNWLRAAGITIKIICDPHQSIYEFRGGVSAELFKLRDSFPIQDRLRLNGNFRSTPNICQTFAAFRASGEQVPTDRALGPYATDATCVYILQYPGVSITNAIGERFRQLLGEFSLKPRECPVVSSTKEAAFKAIGQNVKTATQDRTLRLAMAVSAFHAAEELNARATNLEAVHDIVLQLGGDRKNKTYHQHVLALGIKPEDWRPSMVELCQALRYDPQIDKDSDGWLRKARSKLSPLLPKGTPLSQTLRSNEKLSAILAFKPTSSLSARTIHSVKGLQFPGLCLVLSTACKEVIDYLTTGQPDNCAEGSRKMYVAASRAERLLVIAVPRSQGRRLISHIEKTGASIKSEDLD